MDVNKWYFCIFYQVYPADFFQLVESWLGYLSRYPKWFSIGLIGCWDQINVVIGLVRKWQPIRNDLVKQWSSTKISLRNLQHSWFHIDLKNQHLDTSTWLKIRKYHIIYYVAPFRIKSKGGSFCCTPFVIFVYFWSHSLPSRQTSLQATKKVIFTKLIKRSEC